MARKLPPLILLITEMVSPRDLLFNRLTIILAAILLVSAGAVGYAGANNDGEFTGEVVTENGEPVENATVVLRDIPLQGVVETQRTVTDADGTFRFDEQRDLLEYRIDVVVDGETVAQKRDHLYFRGQNRHVTITIPEENATDV